MSPSVWRAMRKPFRGHGAQPGRRGTSGGQRHTWGQRWDVPFIAFGLLATCASVCALIDSRTPSIARVHTSCTGTAFVAQQSKSFRSKQRVTRATLNREPVLPPTPPYNPNLVGLSAATANQTSGLILLQKEASVYDWGQQFTLPSAYLKPNQTQTAEVQQKSQRKFSTPEAQSNHKLLNDSVGKPLSHHISSHIPGRDKRISAQPPPTMASVTKLEDDVFESSDTAGSMVPLIFRHSKRQMLKSALFRVKRFILRQPSYVSRSSIGVPAVKSVNLHSTEANNVLSLDEPSVITQLPNATEEDSWISTLVGAAHQSIGFVLGAGKQAEHAIISSLLTPKQVSKAVGLDVNRAGVSSSDDKESIEITISKWVGNAGDVMTSFWRSLPFMGENSGDPVANEDSVDPRPTYISLEFQHQPVTGISSPQPSESADPSIHSLLKGAAMFLHSVFSLYKTDQVEDITMKQRQFTPKPIPDLIHTEKHTPRLVDTFLRTITSLPVWSTFDTHSNVITHTDTDTNHRNNINRSLVVRAMSLIPYVRLLPLISSRLRTARNHSAIDDSYPRSSTRSNTKSTPSPEMYPSPQPHLTSGPKKKTNWRGRDVTASHLTTTPSIQHNVAYERTPILDSDLDALLYFQDTGALSTQPPEPISDTGVGVDMDDELLNDTFPVRLQKGSQMRKKPAFVGENFPIATAKDFSAIRGRLVSVAVSAATAVLSNDEAVEFVQDVGIDQLTKAIMEFPSLRVTAVDGITNLLKRNITLGPSLLDAKLIEQLVTMVEAPLKGGLFKNSQERAKELYAQSRVLEMLYRMLLADRIVEERLRNDTKLVKALLQISSYQWSDEDGIRPPTHLLEALTREIATDANTKQKKSSSTAKQQISASAPNTVTLPKQPIKAASDKKSSETKEQTRIRELEVASSVVARKLMWGLGGMPWKPKQPGQKGLRILSFDGGGTRGVLSIAVLKNLLDKLDKQPWELFDIICGTSTGGILAMLFGGYCKSLNEVEVLYDGLIDRIFDRRYTSTTKLVVEQAFYSESVWETVLEGLCGNDVMLDTAGAAKGPRVFCVSTMLSVSPGLVSLWRNYNYPPGYRSSYWGSYRVPTKTAVRATTAAPTFFKPVTYKGKKFCDGAMMANNPTAVAIHEAKSLFPGVPIECVVSIGTGIHQTERNSPNFGWDGIVSQLVSGATDTEHVHSVLNDFLAPEQYYRWNPEVEDLPIDETRPEKMADLKSRAEKYFTSEHIKEKRKALQRILRGR